VRVLIYAPAARMGGARAHVLGVVPELAELVPSDDVLLMAQPDLVADLPALPPNWLIRSEQAQHRSFVGRLVWEQRTLPRIAERWRADVLLSFGAFVPLRSPCATVLEAANALYFTHVYWHVLEREPLRLRMQERARWSLLRASLRAAERVLVPTRAMRQDVVVRLPELISRVDVVHWGVASGFHSAARWAPPPGQAALGISNHGINKEFDVLVRAAALLGDRAPRLRVTMTGRADESRYARRTAGLVQRLGLQSRACFIGDVPNAKMPELIGQSSVVVYPTWCESFGLPLAEALAMGAPAVAADIPACREVGGDAARYYSPGDPTSLATCIAELVEAPDEAAALGEQAAARGQQFTWRANAAGVLATLHKAVR
jgi:glycosyltransferase involved in cell wall biosynthesis